MSKSYTGGLNGTWPTLGDTGWASVVDTFLTTLSSHAHTGAGDGVQISTSALAANSVTGAKILLANAEALRARNASATITSLLQYNASNILEVLQPMAMSSSETLVASGAVSVATALTILNGASLAMTLANAPTEGQLKLVVNIASTPATVTPATTAGSNTVSLLQYGFVLYAYVSAEWRVLASSLATITDDVETLAANGAVSVKLSRTILNGSSLVMTLADGVEGQLKWVVNINATNATVTPATTNGANTILLGQYGAVLFEFLSGEWRAYTSSNAFVTDDSQSLAAAGTYNGTAKLMICTGTTYTVTTPNGYAGQTVMVSNQASGAVTFGGQSMATLTYYLYSYLNGAWRRVALT